MLDTERRRSRRGIWLAAPSFDSRELTRYCAALANEGGGRLVLGITNKRPRRVVGSAAFANLGRAVHRLLQQLRLRIVAEEVEHPDGRVVVFTVPSRPIGVPIQVDGRYLVRSGESLTGMTAEMLRAIFDEGSPDFSAETCPAASIDDLDPAAVERFRTSRPSQEARATRFLHLRGQRIQVVTTRQIVFPGFWRGARGWLDASEPTASCVDTELLGQFTICRTAAGQPCPAADLDGCADHGDSRGWWSSRFTAQIVFYDPAALRAVAAGDRAPHEPQPYASLDIDVHLFHNPAGVEPDMLGTGAQRHYRIGAAAFDRASRQKRAPPRGRHQPTPRPLARQAPRRPARSPAAAARPLSRTPHPAPGPGARRPASLV